MNIVNFILIFQLVTKFIGYDGFMCRNTFNIFYIFYYIFLINKITFKSSISSAAIGLPIVLFNTDNSPNVDIFSSISDHVA